MALAPITSIPTQLITDGTIVSGDLNASDAANFRTVLDITAGSPAFKNLIIGGDFTTNPWQRGTSGFTSVGYTADRWKLNRGGPSGFTVSQQADAPTMAQAGVMSSKSLEVLCTTSEASPVTSSVCNIFQRIEAVNCSSLGFGATGAASVTVSFWYKTNVSGNYTVYLANNATRGYAASVALTGDGTWRKATVTIAGDTAGTWAVGTNATGLEFGLTLMSGTTYQQAPNSWANSTSGNVVATNSSPVNLASAVNNYFRLALVQLEVGTSATSFEALPADVVLARCYRYYWQPVPYPTAGYAAISLPGNRGSTTMCMALQTPVLMRSTPTVVGTMGSAGRLFTSGGSVSSIVTSITPNDVCQNGGNFDVNLSSASNGGSALLEIYYATGTATPFGLSAEL